LAVRRGVGVLVGVFVRFQVRKLDGLAGERRDLKVGVDARLGGLGSFVGAVRGAGSAMSDCLLIPMGEGRGERGF
jgi:hypothetical protein